MNYQNKKCDNTLVAILILSFLAAGTLTMLWYGSDRTKTEVKLQLKASKDLADTVVIAELEEGPYIQRVVDKKLGVVCLVNAAGGGMVCFDLKTMAYKAGFYSEVDVNTFINNLAPHKKRSYKYRTTY